MTSKPDEPDEAPFDFAVDRIPTVDDEQPIAIYHDWIPSQTRVITYAVGDLGFKGIRVSSRDEAVAHCTKNHGKILEANYTPGRAFLRVMR